MTASPDWNLLPQRPREFFGLAEGFDRKTLKRAYNALLRKYKPEKYPNEFQKIRSAYEMLDGQLRYGQTVETRQLSEQYQWRPTPVAQEKVTPSRQPAQAATVDTITATLGQLKKHPPQKIYEHLQRKQNKTPQDFFVLALLSDVVGSDEMLFAKWLLAGLKEAPNEPGLFALLYEYFRGQLPTAHLPQILLATSKIIRSDRFYFLTEHLWDQLLAEGDFGLFRETLAKCEKNLRDFRIHLRITFYLHILKAAIWKADADWIKHQFEWLEQNYSEIPREMEQDVELIFWLRDYWAESPSIIAGDPTRQQIHDAIASYFSLDGHEADSSVIACQSQLANNPQQLLDAFSLKDDHCNPMFLIWYWISQEVRNRNFVESRVDPREFSKQIYRVMKDIDRSEHIGSGYDILYMAVCWLPYLLFAVVPVYLLWPWLTSTHMVFLCFLLGFVGVVMFHFWLRPKSAEPWFKNHMTRVMQRKYMQNWRGQFLPLLQSSQATLDQTTAAMHNVVMNNLDHMSISTWLLDFLPRDFGLKFFALSTRFMR